MSRVEDHESSSIVSIGGSVHLEAEAGKFDHVGNSSEARERNEGLMHRPIAKSKACRGGCGLLKCPSGNHTSKPATKLKYFLEGGLLLWY